MTTVKGTRDKKLKKLIAIAVQYYCSRLMTKRLMNNIYVDVVLKKDLDESGYCEITDYNKSGKPRYFTIEIDKSMNVKSILMTLAHECVHVKQYALGEINENLSVWRGKRVNSDTLPYWDHPWEVEAYGKERGLFVRFSEAHDISDKINGQLMP